MYKQVKKTIKIFSCNSNTPLANDIATRLGTSLGLSFVDKFSDGEINLRIDETVREVDVYIVQSTSTPANDHLMELLIMIDAVKRASAGRVNAVIPYFGYARQDRKTRARDPISAKLIANLLTKAGADRIVTLDLHCAQIQGFFDIPVDNLSAMPLFVDYYRKKFASNMDDVIIVSPDLGSVGRARHFAEKLNVPLAILDKRRPAPNVSEVVNIIGDVKGKTIILYDDIIDTGGTITNGARALLKDGAKEIYCCATHGVLSGNAIDNIRKSGISEMLFTNSVNIPPEKMIDQISVISVADLLAESIFRINTGQPVSPLFTK